MIWAQPRRLSQTIEFMGAAGIRFNGANRACDAGQGTPFRRTWTQTQSALKPNRPIKHLNRRFLKQLSIDALQKPRSSCHQSGQGANRRYAWRMEHLSRRINTELFTELFCKGKRHTAIPRAMLVSASKGLARIAKQ